MTKRAQNWMEIIDNWVINGAKSHKHRVMVVVYEDLKSEEEEYVGRMVNFLNLGGSSDNKTDDLAVTRPLQNFTRSFHRIHSSTEEPFEPYTSHQKAYIVGIISQTQKKLEKHNLTSVLNVSRYLAKHDTKTFVGKLHENDNGFRT